jgi:hypothetical protein
VPYRPPDPSSPQAIAESDRHRLEHQGRTRQEAIGFLLRRCVHRAVGFWLPSPPVVVAELRDLADALEQEHRAGALQARWAGLRRRTWYRPGNSDGEILEAARAAYQDERRCGRDPGVLVMVDHLRRRGLRRRSIEFRELVRAARTL